MIATAPGKLHLAGEYAVLDGAEAVVVAIDRRVVARVAGTPRDPSPFLDAVEAALAARGLERAATLARTIAVDSSALHERGTKLGLGSSAAVTVAAVARALAADASDGPALDREAVHAIARAAHASAQGPRGARGSGADVAAATFGGALSVTPSPIAGEPPRIRPVELPPLELVPFWTGVAADTPTLVAAVAAAAAAPATAAAITDIALASEALAGARTTRAAIAAIAAGAEAIAALAAATGLALEPPVVAAARRIAAAAGGAAKTTGAGAGDVAIAVLPPGADVARVRTELAAAGATPLDLRIDARGVDIQPGEV
jgi:phosphomevalonate kinase